MLNLRVFTLTLVSALLFSFSTANSTKILSSVAQNVDHARECISAGKFTEAQAYAEMTLFTRKVTYCTKNDMFGTARVALDAWQQCLGGDILFVEAPANQADLQIEFKSSRISASHDFMGLATTRRSVHEWDGVFTYRVTGAIEVATQTPNGQTVSLQGLMNTAMHEIGHFLGLDDARGKGLVMGPINLQHPVTMPDASEIECLTDLRESSLTLLQAAEAEIYGVQLSR